MDTQEGRGGAGEEDADLVDGVVGWVEGAELGEGRVAEGEEQGGTDALVDGVFGDVDEEEGKHAGSVLVCCSLKSSRESEIWNGLHGRALAYAS